MFADIYAGARVFVTGHTGFKGSWLSLWLAQLGAQVTGYALAPPAAPNLFTDAGVAAGLRHVVADIRDGAALRAALVQARPHFVFHLAAQPLVLASYAAPAETFAVNLGGSIALMEAIRHTATDAAVVMVTTDKVYRNAESGGGPGRPFAEDDPLGGHDPYSASKAAMEIAVASWRDSFFRPAAVRIATARAGNVIGGGDWAAGRIVPDLARALIAGVVPQLRHPGTLRPWQHVLEPLAGYLWLGARLAAADGPRFAAGWNFGPDPADIQPVSKLAEAMLARWGVEHGWADISDPAAPHEAAALRLAIAKAAALLDWRPVWSFAETVARTADWYREVHTGGSAGAACAADIAAFCAAAARCGVSFAA